MKCSLLSLFLLAGCATARALDSGAQARLDQCEPTLRTGCHDHAHGDPVAESACMRSTRSEYGLLATESEQRRYLARHGCTQAGAQ